MAWSLVRVLKGFLAFVFMIFYAIGGVLLIAGIALIVYNFPKIMPMFFLDAPGLINLVLLVSASVSLYGISTAALSSLL